MADVSKTSTSDTNAEISSSSDSSSSSSGDGSSSNSSESSSKHVSSEVEKPYEYHMRKARVSKRCKEIVFPDQSSSSCKDDAVFADILSSAVIKGETESVLSYGLSAPIKQKLLYPGLAETIAKKDEQRGINRTAKKMKILSSLVKKAAEMSQIHFTDFATEHIKLSPIRSRKYHQSDAGLYDTYAHRLASTAARKLSYFESPDPGLEEGLPIEIDASKDVRLLIGEYAREQAIINPDLITVKENDTATKNKNKIRTHLQTFKLKRPDFTLTDAGFVDADISVGIAGARLFEKHVDEELEWPLQKQRDECERRRESCARRLSAEGQSEVRRNNSRTRRLSSDFRRKSHRGSHRVEPFTIKFHETMSTNMFNARRNSQETQPYISSKYRNGSY